MSTPAPVDRRPASAERGFTLVEVLVGALVLGIFLSFIYGVVISAFRVRDVVQSSTSALAQGSLAMDLIARDLEGAFWRPIQDFDCFRAEEEGSRGTKVDFLTTTDSRSQEEIDERLLRSDIAEVGYRTRALKDGMALYRREQFGVDDKPLEGGDFYKVLAGVKEFRIDWFEKDPTEDDPSDEPEGEIAWDLKEKKRLPRAGRILLVIEGQSSDPNRVGERQEFRFTRWVVLPGADDKEAPAATADGGGAQPDGGDAGGGNPGGGNPGGE